MPHRSRCPPACGWSATFSADDAGWVVAERAEIGLTVDVWSEEDVDLGCVSFIFGDDLYGGFWASVTCSAGDIPDGACCLGSQCLLADAFDCRELGGWFLEDAFVCLPAPAPAACVARPTAAAAKIRSAAAMTA